MKGKEKIITRIISTVLILLSISSFKVGLQNNLHTYSYSTSNEAYKWTVLVYLSGDSNLEDEAIEALNQLEKGKKNSDNLAVIALIDQNEYYNDSNVDWSETRLYEILPDSSNKIKSKLLVEYGELDLGSEDTLEMFLDYGFTNYSAEHYLFIGFNHGGGYLGWSYDYGDTNKSSNRLHLSQTRRAFERSEEIIGRKVDIISLFACNMAYLEVAYEFRNVANYFIAEQMSGWGEGMNYKKIIEAIEDNPNIEPKKLTLEICDIFRNSFINKRYKTTISVIDLEVIDDFVAKFSFLSELLMCSITDGSIPYIISTILSSYQYSYIGRDLFGLLQNFIKDTFFQNYITGFINQICHDLLSIQNNLVICNKPHLALKNKAFGLNIYCPFPYSKWGQFTSYNNTSIVFGTDMQFTDDSYWNLFLSDFYNNDLDDDSLNDWFEYYYNLDPFSNDCNNDGEADKYQDFDNDSIYNINEQIVGSNPWLNDTDMDGLSDSEEIRTYETKPFLIDSDYDTIPDGIEVKRRSNPADSDSRCFDYYFVQKFWKFFGIPFISVLIIIYSTKKIMKRKKMRKID